MRRMTCFRCGALLLLANLSAGCSFFGCGAEQPRSAGQSPAGPNTPPAAVVPASDAAPPADKTGGFDGQKAYAHVEQLVRIGPREPATEGIRRAQAYIRGQLESFGCTVEEDNFTAQTPVGAVAMRNIVAKIPGASSSVVLLLTHYDTTDSRRIANFVGANDSGSSTGVMLEMARLLCRRKNALTIWIAFLDGEEAFVEWSATDSVYGSRQMAAKLAMAGELKRVKAVILADLVGYRNLRFKRETNSAKWLVDMVWSTAARLGYTEQFTPAEFAVDDDHMPFVRRGVPAVDIIQLDDYPHWHTAEDTLDKISPRSLAIVGHVLLEVLPQLEKRFR